MPSDLKVVAPYSLLRHEQRFCRRTVQKSAVFVLSLEHRLTHLRVLSQRT